MKGENSMKKYLSLFLALLLVALCAVSFISASEETESFDKGYVVVTDFGAFGQDKDVDTEAFVKALATGKNIYVPEGNYYVSKTVKLSDRILRGCEPGSSRIYGTMTDKTAPIVLMEGISSLYDIMIDYSDSKSCIDANAGEKVGVQLGSAEKGLMPGSVLRSVRFHNIGTGIYNPANAECNGVLIENIEIYQYYRGIDMHGENRVGNSYSNVYINYHNTEKAIVVDCGFALEGSSYGETIHQLNVEHNTYKTASAILKNAKNFNISVMHFEGVNLLNDDSGWLYCENSSGYIGTLTNYFTYMNSRKNSMIRLGDSDGTNKIVIGTLHNRGLNAPDTNSHTDWVAEIAERGLEKGMITGGVYAKDFVLFRRAKGAKGEYEITLDFYSYYYYKKGETPYYLNYMDKNDNIKFTIKHKPEEAAL